jgi:toxin FitB
MKCLLDDNVFSEWWKPKPDARVVAWIESAEWYVPAPVIAEIQEGAEAHPSQSRKVQINSRLDDFLRDFDGLVIVWDAETSRTWGTAETFLRSQMQAASIVG